VALILDSLKGEKNMRIAIPLAEGRLTMHFGHCERFAFVDANQESKEIVSIETLTPPEHVPGLFPKWVREQGADLVIAGGMGERAQELFAEQGIKVIAGAPADSPEELVNAYFNGTLVTGKNACDH
jgi:predicted Fe-Mo cluster-binding NifX family protein